MPATLSAHASATRFMRPNRPGSLYTESVTWVTAASVDSLARRWTGGEYRPLTSKGTREHAGQTYMTAAEIPEGGPKTKAAPPLWHP